MVQCENPPCGKIIHADDETLPDWITLSWSDSSIKWDACSEKCAQEIILSGVFKT